MSGLVADVRARRGAFEVVARIGAAPGETVALLGPNGAGKSTMVAAIAGLIPLDDGEVVVDGATWERPSARVRLRPQERSLGVVFQRLHLLPALTVIDNVAYGPRSRGVARRAARARALAVLERLDASALAARRTQSLSGGEAQTVALARALAADARVLLLDEPLSAFDVEGRVAARETLGQVLREQDGVRVLITHDPADALALADRVVILEHGRVVQEGTLEQIRRDPRSDYAAAVSAEAPPVV